MAAESLPEDRALARLLPAGGGPGLVVRGGIAAPVLDVVLAESAGDATDGRPARGGRQPAGRRRGPGGCRRSVVGGASLGWHRTPAAGSPLPARHVGVLRSEQGWIGGVAARRHLVTPPEEVPASSTLVASADREDVEPVVQAAVAHAQFEVVHPARTGNSPSVGCWWVDPDPSTGAAHAE